ncbi:hypothetical protein MF406_04680 [Georgenia sp. TF02-10]|nr:DUF5615 family PIN-like protein [Georgenia sp. TF02-10]UNX55561.1 hypothetical protein MF406_04680 [Georgenia sp. TF02-10]
MVTKDADFHYAYLATSSPERLLLVATGNIRNDDLLALFDERLDDIAAAFTEAKFVKFHREVLIVHG